MTTRHEHNIYRKGNKNKNMKRCSASQKIPPKCQLKLHWGNFFFFFCLLVFTNINVFNTTHIGKSIEESCTHILHWPEEYRVVPPLWGTIRYHHPKLPVQHALWQRFTLHKQNGVFTESYLFSAVHNRKILELIQLTSTPNRLSRLRSILANQIKGTIKIIKETLSVHSCGNLTCACMCVYTNNISLINCF